MKEIEYTVSNEIEKSPVGTIIYYYPYEVMQYYSEKELLKEYKEAIYQEGCSIKIKMNKTKEKPRHGLTYELRKLEYGEFGRDYSKKDYENSLERNKERDRER